MRLTIRIFSKTTSSGLCAPIASAPSIWITCYSQLQAAANASLLAYEQLPSLKLTAILAPENGWLEYDPFLLGFGLFSGAFAVSFREGTIHFSKIKSSVLHLLDSSLGGKLPKNLEKIDSFLRRSKRPLNSSYPHCNKACCRIVKKHAVYRVFSCSSTLLNPSFQSPKPQMMMIFAG